MKSAWPQHIVLRTASLLAPGDRRAEWLREWRSELWYVPRREAMRFCLGAFRDALWLRRNEPSPAKRSGIRLESPLSCLAFLAALAAVSSVVAVLLPAPPVMGPRAHLRTCDVPVACLGMLVYSCLLLPATRFALWPAAAGDRPMPPAGRLRRGAFLALKIVLVQPAMLCGVLVWIWIAPVAPFAPLAILAAWILPLRWVFADQRRRCPVCLRLLINPVRIGTPSQTFLEWYGAESMCSRGHGLLRDPEISASYCGGRQWLRLDDSWSGLFPHAAGARQS